MSLQVREIVPDDKPILDAAADADPWHKAAGLTGEHWLRGNALMYCDELGPVMAVRNSSVARVDIQFMTQSRGRNMWAMLCGFQAYIAMLEKRGVEEILCTTDSNYVAHFICKRFHFRPLGSNTYSLYIKGDNGRS